MTRAQKVLDRMRRTSAGWRPKDLRAVYLGFGFEEHEGAKHTRYWHPVHRHLWTTVPRSAPLSKAYAEQAVALIEELTRLEEDGHGPDR